MFTVPGNPLFQGRFRRHGMLSVPVLVHLLALASGRYPIMYHDSALRKAMGRKVAAHAILALTSCRDSKQAQHRGRHAVTLRAAPELLGFLAHYVARRSMSYNKLSIGRWLV